MPTTTTRTPDLPRYLLQVKLTSFVITSNHICVSFCLSLQRAVDVHFWEAAILGGCGDPCFLPLQPRSHTFGSHLRLVGTDQPRQPHDLEVGHWSKTTRPASSASAPAPWKDSLSLTGDLQVNSCARPPHPGFEDLLTRRGWGDYFLLP